MPERYYRELLRYFTRKSGDGHTAADVVQEAYARIYALQDSGGAILEPRALLYHAGRNIAATAAARRAAEQRVLDTLGLVSADSVPSVEGQVIARQQLDRLMQRLAVMPPKRRAVFILVRVHGYSYAEAGERMGLNVTAIERHVMRGILDCAGLAPARA
ncbi:RNA polymerase sigma factor [Pigmentiphaga litoralis]|uniref:RNA polymerase sigma-70 factor (ECF subfamily) n=1 Tax=Pigmentiphaga litoralis TaxID=516702 RepID=A0A7Y9IS30_9BURK|nr:RNA polymerase sigma factor [Pigmentiphaga litoralis]NYE24399.1 RNA polymerase sigma-70 factor (ECF subfamily) [Pigmentiphaga litoralis]NYE81987.1 RNA polymerase sigma-70 factor (ECF subfamily) [Pigmentiphaga litoralis]